MAIVRLVFVWLGIISISVVKAQVISIGNKMPIIKVGNVLNYKSDKLDLAVYKGKAFMIAFWGTNCTGCILEMPRLDSLQNKWGDRMQILLVNKQNPKVTETFFQKRKMLKVRNMPLITADTVFNSMFPHDGDPYSIWIDSTGTVRYMTSGSYVTNDNIRDFVNGAPNNIQNRVELTYTETLFDNRWTNLLEYYSFIARCGPSLNIEGGDGSFYNGDRKYYRITYQCYSIPQLYQVAYDSLTKNEYEFSQHPLRTIIEVGDASKYVRPASGIASDKWDRENAYNYQAMIRDDKKEDLSRIMKADLDKQFDLYVCIESRPQKCLVLIKGANFEKLKTRGGQARYNFSASSLKSPKSDSIRGMYNQPYPRLSIAMSHVVESGFKRLFVDSVNYEGNIDFWMRGSVRDNLTLAGLTEALRINGLDLVERVVYVPCLIIRERTKLGKSRERDKEEYIKAQQIKTAESLQD